jgi:hypothetical protein
MRTINRPKETPMKHTVPLLTSEEVIRTDRISLRTLRDLLPKFISNRRHDFKGIREIKEGIKVLEEGIYGTQPFDKTNSRGR